MIAATNHPYRIARVCCSPSAPRLSKAGLSDSSPGRPAASFHDCEQRTTHRRARAAHTRLGAGRRDASFLVRVLLLHGQGCLCSDLPDYGRCFGIGRLFAHSGIGRRANAILASIQHGRQGTFQRLAKGPHSHFQNSRLNAINLDRGGHDEIHEHSASGAANDR